MQVGWFRLESIWDKAHGSIVADCTPMHKFSVLFSASLLVVGCGSTANKGNAQINGRVIGSGSAARADTNASTVTAFTVDDQGRLVSISGEADVAVDGRYTLKVNVSDVTSDIIVQASTGGVASAKTIVSAAVVANATVMAAPANTETTVEADIFIDARAHGWDSNASSAGLRRFVDAKTAAKISIGTTYTADIHTAALAVMAALDARAQTMTSVGATASAVQAFVKTETDAQVQADIALDAATTDAAVTVAVEAEDSAVAAGAVASGISNAQQSAGVSVAAYAAGSVGVQLSADAQAAWRLHAAHLRADAEARTNSAALAALAASASATADAAAAKGTLDSAIDASAGVQAAIDTAVATYHTAIKADFKSSAVSLRVGADTSIESVGAASATFAATLNAALVAAGADTQKMATAFATFATSISASVHADVVLSGLAAPEVEASVALATTLGFAG